MWPLDTNFVMERSSIRFEGPSECNARSVLQSTNLLWTERVAYGAHSPWGAGSSKNDLIQQPARLAKCSETKTRKFSIQFLIHWFRSGYIYFRFFMITRLISIILKCWVFWVANIHTVLVHMKWMHWVSEGAMDPMTIFAIDQWLSLETLPTIAEYRIHRFCGLSAWQLWRDSDSFFRRPDQSVPVLQLPTSKTALCPGDF